MNACCGSSVCDHVGSQIARDGCDFSADSVRTTEDDDRLVFEVLPGFSCVQIRRSFCNELKELVSNEEVDWMCDLYIMFRANHCLDRNFWQVFEDDAAIVSSREVWIVLRKLICPSQNGDMEALGRLSSAQEVPVRNCCNQIVTVYFDNSVSRRDNDIDRLELV